MTGRIKIMKALGFKIGHFTVTSAFKANYARIKNAEIKSKSYTLEARRASRMRKKATNEHFAELEDRTPKHSKCLTGSTSWCLYKRALAKNEKPMSHSPMKTKLSEQVLEKILPVYQRYANDELLERCSDGKTQNTNKASTVSFGKTAQKKLLFLKSDLK
ncbi:uncharacterized protein TNCV_3934521 [Trichonephila clavipes]|nr:uncharacterized protein TNCV_3934521 [Trichonephila clavipes]